jgi:hypothetical protein
MVTEWPLDLTGSSGVPLTWIGTISFSYTDRKLLLPSGQNVALQELYTISWQLGQAGSTGRLDFNYSTMAHKLINPSTCWQEAATPCQGR